MGKFWLKRTELRLSDYLQRLLSPLDCYSAVTLLMPIAIELKNKHDSGSVCLRLFPARILVTENGCKLIDSSEQPSDLFIAPEQKNGGFAGIAADVYAVCAVLRYMLTLNLPAKNDKNNDEASTELDGIINKGMSELPNERFSTMQDLIHALAPFNTGVSEAALVPFVKRREEKKSIEALNIFDATTALNANEAGALTDDSKLNVLESEINLQSTDQPTTPNEVNSIAVINEDTKTNSQKRTLRRWLLGAAVVCVALVIATGFTWRYLNNCCEQAMEDMDKFLFAEAVGEFEEIPYGEKLFPEESLYIYAGSLMAAEEYAAAETAFSDLNEYREAEAAAKEAKYQKAKYYLETKQFISAQATFLSLVDYKDSNELEKEAQYLYAKKLIAEGDSDLAEPFLRSLDVEGYASSHELLLDICKQKAADKASQKDYYEAFTILEEFSGEEGIDALISDYKDKAYKDAVSVYNKGSYWTAYSLFKKVEGYKHTSDYITLIEAHTETYRGVDDAKAKKMVRQLKSLLGFADASELVVRDRIFGHTFLVGNWTGNGKHFTMNSEGQISYNLPYFRYGDYYTIQDGAIVLFPEDDEDATKPLFFITVYTEDCIEVFCYKSCESYMLYRQ